MLIKLINGETFVFYIGNTEVAMSRKFDLLSKIDEVSGGMFGEPDHTALGNMRSIVSSITFIIVLVVIIIFAVFIFKSKSKSGNEGFTTPPPPQSFAAPTGVNIVDSLKK